MTAPQRACAQMKQAKLKLNTVQKEVFLIKQFSDDTGTSIIFVVVKTVS